MTKRMKVLGLSAVVGAALAGSAWSAPFSVDLVTPGGTVGQTTSIDWSQNGSLVIGANTAIPAPGTPATGNTFTVDFWFQSIATTFSTLLLGDEPVGNFAGDGNANGLVTGGTTWELTAVASGTETFKHTGTNVITVQGGSGRVEWYLDYFPTDESQGGLPGADTSAANPSGSGYADGKLVLAGDFVIVPGSTITFGGAATNSTRLLLSPEWVDTTVFNPDLFGADIETTIQFDLQGGVAGNILPGGTIGTAGVDSNTLPADLAHGLPPGVYQTAQNLHTVGGIDVTGDGIADIPDIVLRADANSTFTPVPEPTTMVLLGSGLLGIAGLSRRKKKA